MYSAPYTRADLSRLYGAEKKELTAKIRAEKQAGRLIQRMVHRDPVRGGGRKVIFQTLPDNLELPLTEKEPNHVV